MASVTTSQIGNGTTAYATDIVVKDLDLDVSNRVKDDTPVLNMAMSKKRKVNSTLPLWTVDTYRTPAIQANTEGAAVGTPESNSRGNLGNYTQIFSTTVGASNTARAVEQSGGDPQAYMEVKQLVELMFDVEAQILRNDQIGTKYAGQSGSATGLPSGQTGRRFGSLNAFAGTHSFNPTTTTSGSESISTFTNNESTDSATETANTLNVSANGSQYYEGTFTNQQFGPILYKQLVTLAEQRFNAKVRTIVAPTSLRTSLSDNMPTSRGINRVDASKGDTITTYEGDFNYTYEIMDSWIMDSIGVSDQIYFLNEEVIQWGSLRDLAPNNEVFSNADAALDQFVMEGTLIVRNPAGVAVLHNIGGTTAATAGRGAAFVKRYA
jgi:hypothetical protein